MSGKISLGIGKSPCSNGSRRGWITELEFGFGVGAGSGLGSVVDVVSVVMVFQREREREREKVEVGRELDWIFWRKQNTTSKTHFKARWELRGA